MANDISDRFDLRKKFDALSESSSLKDLQSYIEQMKHDRGFQTVSIDREWLLFTEEIGELAKAIRKHTGGRFDKNPENFGNVDEELADCFIYLASIANMLNVDIFEALKKKETVNFTRNWKINTNKKEQK